VPASHHC